MIDKGINVKKIDLSGVSFPTSDASTCALIYTAVHNTYGFPLYLTNFKINDEKRDSILVNPVILENQTIVNLNDCHLIVTPADISVGEGVYGASLESIVDKDGNPRFVEGDITMETISGITQTYGKWSLSGTHLMIVVTLRMENGTTITGGGTSIFKVYLPQWILDKIVPLFDIYVGYNNFRTIGDGTDTDIPLFLKKVGNYLNVVKDSTAYVSARNEDLRIQFDLLIDAD